MPKRGAEHFDENIENQYRQELDKHIKLDKLKLRERLRKERLQQDQSTVYFLCLFGIFNMTMIVIPMFGDSWLFASFVGPGIGLGEIKASLFMMSVNVSCETSSRIEKNLCGHILKLGVNGVHPISDIMRLSCGLGVAPRACDIMSRLWWDSWVILFFFSLACLCQFFGVVFLYYYWNIAPAKAIRKWAAIFTCFSPFLILIGLGVYWCLHPDLEELARSWSGMMDALGSMAGGLLSFKSIHPFGTGWCLLWGCATFIFTSLNAMTFPLCLNRSTGEDELEDMEEYERDKILMESLAMESQIGGSYGAGSYGAAGGYPAQQSYQTQQAQGVYGGSMPMPGAYSEGAYQSSFDKRPFDADGTFGSGGYSQPAPQGSYNQGYDARAGPPVPNEMMPGGNTYQQQQW